ncbi:PH domain leucine-rich repeat-containing protein phosphatase 1, partial [Tachysurus ichikawai]
MVSQRISSVDLSCCSLEKLPPNLLYSHDLTHLNLKHNFLPADNSLKQLQ